LNYPDDYINKVICGDCPKVMKGIPDKSVDLVWADPPFNVGKDYGNGKKADMVPNYFSWCKSWIHEGFRILKPTGSFYLMNITRNIGNLQCIMNKYGVFVNLIIWKNVCSWASKRGYYPKYQPILFYGKTKDYYFDTYAQREKPFARWGKMTGKMQGQMGDIWMDIPFVWAGSTQHPEAILASGSRAKIHPTQMPTNLARRVIVFSSPINGICIDLFAGVGAFEESAHDLSRRFIGIDINSDYCKIAEQRLVQEILL
jgi:DNA modification methylase